MPCDKIAIFIYLKSTWSNDDRGCNNRMEEPMEKQLWKLADKLRKNIDAAEYKHVVLGLIFLRFLSHSFDSQYVRLKSGKGKYAGADPEDKSLYKTEDIFFVPKKSRWSYIQDHAQSPFIGELINGAMDVMERENVALKGILPKVYNNQNIDPSILTGLLHIIGNIELDDYKVSSIDFLGHVFEYFLGEFALAEGKKGGQFYTPRSVVKLLVEMMQPIEGRIFDPCCGSGGMFVQLAEYVAERHGKIDEISIFGQESNLTSWRLAKMNLAIRGIDSSQVKWNYEGSLLKNVHTGLNADFIIANPPFNVKDWGGEALRKDSRWVFGVPPLRNANYAWIQHFLYHLSPNGLAGFVLAKGALTSKRGGEDHIRKRMVESDVIDCIVNLPSKLFLNTKIPASLWFVRNGRSGGAYKNRSGEILFIDARNLGKLLNRRTKELTREDINQITSVYHNWLNHRGNYQDVKGFCASVGREQVAEEEYVLTPGRYVGLEEEESQFDFGDQLGNLIIEFEQQVIEESKLNDRIITNLNKIKMDDGLD